MIHVTKTFLPPQHEYDAILKRAWDAEWITNRGTLVKELESKLKQYLKSPSLIAMTNGTLPLQIGIKALGLRGEIITTPFSYVATTSSIVWEGCTPVFVDIDPVYFSIDEKKIEAAITTKTTAILATHVFGNPCAVHEIEAIAKKHSLKVIYDAAHCFGVTYHGESIFNFGDLSTCSFHATKLFHTGEGGAIFSKDEIVLDTLFYHHNFGHRGKENFSGIGINGKMSELQAAMGLAVFPYIDTIIGERTKVVDQYDALLNFSKCTRMQIREGTDWNYSYYPIVFESEVILKNVMEALNRENIFPRRYFYPSLNSLPYVSESSCPISESISNRILCLPLSANLSMKDVERICTIVKKTR